MKHDAPAALSSALVSLYDSARLAYAYAHARPPVHGHLVERMKRSLGLREPLARALDVGCGAGLSTIALRPLARSLVGLEPVRTMLTHRQAVARGVSFVCATAERMPFADHAFDVIAAGGSVNYMDRDRLLPEVARVLTPGGTFVVYDFSAGRRTKARSRLHEWFAEFEARYPPPAGYAFDVRALDYGRAGLRLDAYEEAEIAIAMSQETYLAYVLSETSVERAISQGAPIDGIRTWCKTTLRDVLGDASHEVLFASYIAYVGHEPPRAAI
jgi:SAM-dependent methyltransferase